MCSTFDLLFEAANFCEHWK